MGATTTAAVHQFFTTHHQSNPKYRTCNTCKKKFSFKSGNSSLEHHLQSQHYTQYHQLKALQQANKSAAGSKHEDNYNASSLSSSLSSAEAASASASLSSSFLSSSKKRCFDQYTLHQSFTEQYNKSTVLNIFSTTFARLSLPAQILEKQEFIDMLNAYRQSTGAPPKRRALRQAHMDNASCLQQRVINTLRQHSSSAPVTIAIDGWTNVRHDKVTNVIPLCAGRAYYWESIVNTVDRNTAEWLYEKLKVSFDSIQSNGILVAALVADNETVNNALFNLLQADYKFLIQIPCAAHTLQLIVKKILALDGVDTLISAMNDILSAFVVSKDNRLKLKNLQLINVNEGEPNKIYALIRPCDTRWSSSYYAAERMLKLQQYIDIIMKQPSSFWDKLRSLIECLQPFQEATDIIQSDSANLFSVYSQFTTLLSCIASLPENHILYPRRNDALDIIIKYWYNNINVSAVIACALLSFSPVPLKEFSIEKRCAVSMSAETLTRAKSWLISDFGAPYISSYRLSDRDDAKDIESSLLNQYAEFRARAGIFSGIQDDIDRIIHSTKNEKTHQSSSNTPYIFFDPKKVWYLYRDTAPELAAVAVALLSIVPSEAAVERSFSMQDSVHTKKRNRLLDSTVKAEMFIRFNSTALDSNITPQGNYMELTDDNVENGLQDMADVFVAANDEGSDELQAEEEEKEEDDASAISPTEAFIQHYILHNRVTDQYRWVEHRLIHLATAAANWDPPIIDTTDTLKRKIVDFVKGRNK
jgi:hypothetical protein